MKRLMIFLTLLLLSASCVPSGGSYSNNQPGNTRLDNTCEFSENDLDGLVRTQMGFNLDFERGDDFDWETSFYENGSLIAMAYDEFGGCISSLATLTILDWYGSEEGIESSFDWLEVTTMATTEDNAIWIAERISTCIDSPDREHERTGERGHDLYVRCEDDDESLYMMIAIDW